MGKLLNLKVRNYKIPGIKLLKWLKLAFTICIFFLLAFQIFRLKRDKEFFKEILDNLSRNIGYFLGAIFLLFPNYFLELWKWQILTSHVEARNKKESLRDILNGLAIGLFTPYMLGDFLGRTASFQSKNKTYVAALNFFNSVCQTYSTIFFGTTAIFLWYLVSENVLKGILLFPSIIMFSISVFGVLFVLKFSFNWKKLQKIKILRPYIKKDFMELDLSTIVRFKILSLSIFRSVIFNLQFVLFYYSFGMILKPALYFIGINLILLVKTIGGGLNIFGDLTLREFVGVNFFGLYNVDESLVLVATFTVWFINIFIPVVGSLFFQPKS